MNDADLTASGGGGRPTRRDLLRRTLFGFALGAGLGLLVGLLYVMLR